MSAAGKPVRLSKVAREFNLGLHTVVEFLADKGHKVEQNPNTKIDSDLYALLQKEFGTDKEVKEQAKRASAPRPERETISIEDTKEQGTVSSRQKDSEEVMIKNVHVGQEAIKPKPVKLAGPKVVDKIDLEPKKKKEDPVEKKKEEPKPPVVETKKEEKKDESASVQSAPPVEQKPEAEKPQEEQLIKAEAEKLEGVKVLGKIELPKEPVRTPKDKSDKDAAGQRKRRKRIVKPKVDIDKAAKQAGGRGRPGARGGEEVDEKAVQKKIAQTLARLTGGGKSRGSKNRRDKREMRAQQLEDEKRRRAEEGQVLKVTEFVTAAELASMMDVQVNEVISACMSLGLMVSINQRLDAETLQVICEEFGYTIEFVSAEVTDTVIEEEDDPKRMQSRPPIVTVMGHVDHGKTSLLDYVRKANVIAGEAGGITQHIGAYSVKVEDGKTITFLDTPGHEAFTAMRARGAQVTDIAIIVIAADDNVMPQTKEAINHAQAAGVPMIFALNKIDKDGANPDKIREELSQMNILTEDWGGKHQVQEISAKHGKNIDLLLEKVLLEAELLDLKADPGKRGTGVVIESTMEHGRGFVTTLLVESGTLNKGDVLIAGQYSGRVRAMFNERGAAVEKAGPATPVSILGLDGAATAGDRFNVMPDEREARNIATRRQQLQREQGIRTNKHITLDEIGRRLAIGDFQELNIIVKGDVDGSVEALTDSLLKLSTENIKVNVIHKAVGPIAESDVLLATASDAIIIGFQVRPTPGARKLAENEEIDIRLYSIIYQAIEEIKTAMEGMLSPEVKEKVVGTAEVRDTFKVSKVGTVAGCMVIDGKITRNNKVRVIRDGIVIYTGDLGSLKRFKDDVKEVGTNYECGLNVERFNDVKVGDHIEAFEEVEVARTLE
jgi:translation initiation factor IF-2